MMNRIYYSPCLLFLLFLVVGQSLLAQETISKKIENKYVLSNSGTITIDHKYGNIQLIGWEKDSLAITIDIAVFHKKSENAAELLNRIEPKIQVNGNIISLMTEIHDKSGSAIARYFSKVNPLEYDKTNIQIDYTIHLPRNLNFEAKNKFGDLIVDDFFGTIKAEFQHGDIWINNNLNNANIVLKYGQLRAQNIAYADLNLKNADLNLSSAKDLILKSNGSSIEIDSIQSLKLNSNKDRIDIKRIANLSGELRFSEFNLDTLDNRLDVFMKVTDFNLNNVQNPEATLFINQESSQITINVVHPLSFKAYLKQGVLRVPKTFTNVNSTIIDETDKIREVKATFGEHPKSTVQVKGEKGTVILRDKK